MSGSKWMRTLTLSLSLAVLGIGASAQTSLPPGSTVSVPLGGLSGTLLASKTVSFSSSVFTGTVREAVVLDGSTHHLDFLYQVFNDSSSSPDDPLARVTMASFAGFTTSVDYATAATSIFDSGGHAPDDATRSGGTGKTIGFDFGTSNTIAPGDHSAILEIYTNADQFTNGTVAVINSQTANTDGYQPTVPEAGTWVSMGMLLGLGGLGLRRMHRR